MGLAYSLNVENLLNLDKLSNAIITAPFVPGAFSSFGQMRFMDATGACQDIFPTGEYIIRDGIFANGFYIYVGSYKAYIRDLFGAGSHGYAWDGFIMAMRGYSINKDNGFNILTNMGESDLENFGFLPMRMPIEVNPGVIADASEIASDSSVGLQAIDFYKSYEDVEVAEFDKSIRIITCGFQRINASAEGAPTDMDYVANLYMAKLLNFSAVIDGTPEGSKFVEYRYESNQVMQYTWKANVAGHADKTNGIGRFGLLRDLDQSIAGNELTTGVTYLYDMWRQGQLPDGSNPGGGPIDPVDKRAISFNQFPRRFLDITCSSQQPLSATENVASTFFLVGDFAADTNDDGSIDDTGPVLLGGSFGYPDEFDSAVAGTSPFSYLPAYLIAHPAIETSLTTAVGGAPSWFREGAVPTYTFSGAVAVLCSIPYEVTSFGLQQPLTFIGVNDVSHGGTKYAEIYTTMESPIFPTCVMLPYATEGGAFTTATSINLPNKWYSKAVQQRTFSIAEENIAKQGEFDITTGVFNPTDESVYDDDAQDYIGYISNYQRYGLTDDPTATGEGIGQGTPSRNGYGFLGLETGVGPVAIMFDSGAGTYTDTGNPETATGIVLAEGANLNANHLVAPTSTTRKIVNAGWDNDRDQWLFISSNSTGVGVISVSADFSTATNNVGFLDQTANFADNIALPLPTTANAGLYIPNSMTNALDGFICFGIWDDDANCRFGIKPILGSSPSSRTETCDGVTVNWDDYLGDSTSYFYRITGTSGREARVWVDYILFDGVDSVIAKKLQEFGMKVNIENVEWFKRKIIKSGDLNIKSEEIEMWMREQQSQYKDMLKEKERMGRIRKKKSQVSAFSESMEEQINPDFMDDEVKDFLGSFTPDTRPPTPEEKQREKKRKGGYEESTDSYYDDAF